MKKENAERTMKAGFTLVELLVVVAIIGIMGAIAVQGVGRHLERTRQTATHEIVKTIASALTAYSIEHNGKFPDSLDALIEGDDDNPPLIEGGDDALNDAWANRIEYEKHGKRFKLTSKGPDEELGTEDDIYYPETKKK